ncbi:MAG TPA: serine hydrolase [Gemmatimonadaceae bacterium]|nr:serine hydrolase [Gemmatimonadaceae bacterium]
MRTSLLLGGAALALAACARQTRQAPPAEQPPLPAPIPFVADTPRVAYSMRYVDLAPGTGAPAAARKCIYAHYTGWLTDGTKFDSSHDTTDTGAPREPIAFPQGARRVIPGWDAGFEGMRVGARRRFVIPYQLAYGELGRPPRIPPKATLIFDVELMAVAVTLPRPADAAPPRTPAAAAPQCPTWAAVSGAAPSPAPTAAASTAAVEASVRARLDALDAHATFYAKQLSTGREIAVRADEPMNTASVIKLPVMILAFRDADAGRLNLDERRTIRPDDLRRGSGLLQTFAVGLRPTLRDLITQMVVTSDNTATDIMIARVGRERVNRMLDSLGFRETRLRMTVGQAFRAVWVASDPKYASLSDREVFARGFPDDSGAGRRTTAFVLDSTKWLGRTTARETARLLERLERGELASAKSTAEMRRILQEQLYSSRLPSRIGFRVAVGHKTGDWPPLLGNDVGILYPPSGPIVMAVFANGNRGPFHELEATEGRIAEEVLDAWEK